MQPSQTPTLLALLAALSITLPAAPGHAQGEAPPPEHEARLETWAAPNVVTVDEPFGGHIEYEHRGDIPWTDDEGYRLIPVHPEDGEVWQVSEVRLLGGEEVEPGDKKVFSVTLRAPTEPGRYRFQWQIVAEDVPIGEPNPEHFIDVVERDPEVNADPHFFRKHRGKFELHPRRPLSVRTDDGQPILLTGKSAFALLARRGPVSFLEEAAEQGFNMVRVHLLTPEIVLANAGEFEVGETGWPWERDLSRWDVTTIRNRYWTRMDTLMDKSFELGMIVQYTLFTPRALTYFENPTVFDEVKQTYVRQVLERLSDREDENERVYRLRQGHAYFEIAHEYQAGADGPGPYPHEGLTAEFVQEVATFILATEAELQEIPVEEVSRTITISGTPSDEPVFADAPWNGFFNLHLPVVEGWETRIRDVMLGLRDRGKPMVDDLSAGVGGSVPGLIPEDRRDDDPFKQRLRFWAATSAGGYATYHTELAVLGKTTGDTPGIDGVRAYRTFFEKLAHWDLEPNQDFFLSDDADGWGMASRNQFAVYFHTTGDGTGTVAVNLEQGVNREKNYEVRWLDPSNGDWMSRTWIGAGRHELELPGLTPDAALLITDREATRTPALTEIEPGCMPVIYDGGIRFFGANFQPGVHILVEGKGPLALNYTDDREATMYRGDFREDFGVEVDRDVYDLVPGSWEVRLRNYDGKTTGTSLLRVVERSDECDEPVGGEADAGPSDDAGEPDAGVIPDEDAGGAPDAGPATDAETSDGGGGGGDGCGCMLAQEADAPIGPPMWWGLVLLSLWGGLRRRR